MATTIGVISVIIILILAYNRYGSIQGRNAIQNPFARQNTAPAVVRSKYLPDDFYVGKTSKLDASLRVMFPNALIGFPDGLLTVKGFRYYEIDGIEHEEIVFEKQNGKDFIVIYNPDEHNMFFLNRVTSAAFSTDETPPIVDHDSLDFEENGNTYTYSDISGLWEVQVTGNDVRTRDRLIRLYGRQVTPEDDEYCVGICDAPDKQGTNFVVDYYIGFMIQKQQLEDL